VAGPTFDGLIVRHSSWSVEFWWTVGLQIVILIMVFLFLEDTGYDRARKTPTTAIPRSASFLRNLMLTFFSTRAVSQRPRLGEMVSRSTGYYRHDTSHRLTESARFVHDTFQDLLQPGRCAHWCLQHDQLWLSGHGIYATWYLPPRTGPARLWVQPAASGGL